MQRSEIRDKFGWAGFPGFHFIPSGLRVLFVWGGNQPQAAGLIPAPWDKLAHLAWMRDNGLEGLHRLLSEPGRLWIYAKAVRGNIPANLLKAIKEELDHD
jgi:hypothetical protein